MHGIITATRLNVRSRPDIKSSKCGVLSKGTEIYITGHIDDWLEFRYKRTDMMKPNREWIDEWRVGVNPSREGQIATDLLDFFPDEGPLVYHGNESWQDEFDMVCRKIYKYMKMNR
jgi:hypothetical protein